MTDPAPDQPHVPFHRTPGIGNVKCWFLNAALDRDDPEYLAWLSAQQDVPVAERAVAVAKFAAATYDDEGPPLVALAWRNPDGTETSSHGTLLAWGDDWLLERADCETFAVRPQDLTEVEVVDL